MAEVEALVQLVRPKNAAMGFLAVLLSEFIASGGLDWSALAAPLAAALILGGGNALNDYFDREVDRVNHPERPIPSGRVSPRSALALSGILLTAGVLVSLIAGLLCAAVALAAVLLLIAYEARVKRSGLPGNALISLLVALLFLFGGIAAGDPRRVLILSLMAFLANLGRELDKDLEDLAGDVDRRTFPKVHGPRATLALSGAMYAAAVSLSPVPYLQGLFGLPYLVLVAASDVIFLMTIWNRNASRRKSMAKVGMLLGLLAFVGGAVHWAFGTG